MSNPVASIVLFSHAPYAGFLRQSLGSILGQSYASIEVIVLGDGSEQVANAAAEFSSDRRLILVSQGDRPFLQAANDLMSASKADYLGTWNSDDSYKRDHVKVLVQCLENDSEAGAAFDNLEYFKAGSDDFGGEPDLIVPRSRPL